MNDAKGRSFSRDFRLVDASGFDAVFKHGSRSSDRYFTVLYRRTELGYPRLGLSMAKKKIPHATTRNHLKRLVRESFRNATETLGSHDIVVMARPAARDCPNERIYSSLAGHWARLAE